jgi:hypothetical protein
MRNQNGGHLRERAGMTATITLFGRRCPAKLRLSRSLQARNRSPQKFDLQKRLG